MSNEACLVLDALIMSAVVALNTVLLRRTHRVEARVGGRRTDDEGVG